MSHPPPALAELTAALDAAGAAHHDYERRFLRGVRDEQWPGFYAAFVLGRLGDFVSATDLAAWLADVTASSGWSAAAARRVLNRLI